MRLPDTNRNGERSYVLLVLGAIVAALVGVLGGAGTPAALASPPESAPPVIRSWDLDARVDANQLDMFLANTGSFAWDISTGNPGLYYPRGLTTSVVYAAGLWVGARVNGETRVTVAEYSYEYAPGPILAPGQWADPSDPAYRVYKILASDGPGSNPDYDQWPVADGAPVGPDGLPRKLGVETLWSVWNDLDPMRHSNGAGHSAPLGIEVRNTAFALDGLGTPGSVVFMEWTIINKGNAQLDDAYVSLWGDPDLGGAVDDLVGCDPALSLGYCYNADNSDTQYGGTPPTVGFQLVQGPIVPAPGQTAYVSGHLVADHRNLPMTAFIKYINGTDPDSPVTSYNYLQGLQADGSPVIDPSTGLPTTFMVSGDPVTGQGWVDAIAADRRLSVSAGPFTMAPGDTQIVAAAIIVGQGQDRLQSVTALRSHATQAISVFRAVMGGATGACCQAAGGCIVATEADCAAGQFFLGVSCDPSPCGVGAGACCYDNGTCVLSTPPDCVGRYQGDGTSCTPALCPIYGPPSACCLGSGTCQMLSEYACIAQGGTYRAEEDCTPLPPGGAPGWKRIDSGNMMIDEIAGAGGVGVPPDSHGGPGNSAWHSWNSTHEWLMSASGGNGEEARFTRDGVDSENLRDADLVMRWDDAPGNIGWWMYDDGQVAPVPFGLYERDPNTGEETRLIPVLYSGGGTVGVYDVSADTPDPYSGVPATDGVYAYRLDPAIADWEGFVADAQDGVIDNDPRGAELFARMILCSDALAVPPAGTVILFSTLKSGILAGSGFAARVPISWPVPSGGLPCVGNPEYEVYRDGQFLAVTGRTDYLDSGSLPPGHEYSYQLKSRDPQGGQVSAFSVAVTATTHADGYSAIAGRRTTAVRAPALDGVVAPGEWSAATRLDATYSGPDASVSVMVDPKYLYVLFEDPVAAAPARIYLDPNGNGVFDADAPEGYVSVENGVRRFTRLQGSYPDVQVVGQVDDPKWFRGAAGDNVAEFRLALQGGPLAGRVATDVVSVFFESPGGAAVYPQGPPVVLERAPVLYCRLTLPDAPPPPAPGAAVDDFEDDDPGDGTVAGVAAVEPAGMTVFPNPATGRLTVAYRAPQAGRVSVEVYGVNGAVVRRLGGTTPVAAGPHVASWDGLDEAGQPVASGTYYVSIRGETFRTQRAVTVIR